MHIFTYHGTSGPYSLAFRFPSLIISVPGLVLLKSSVVNDTCISSSFSVICNSNPCSTLQKGYSLQVSSFVFSDMYIWCICTCLLKKGDFFHAAQQSWKTLPVKSLYICYIFSPLFLSLSHILILMFFYCLKTQYIKV